MSPAILAIIVELVELAIKEAPAIRAELQVILAKNQPTPQDFINLKQKVLSQSFADLAPDAKLS